MIRKLIVSVCIIIAFSTLSVLNAQEEQRVPILDEYGIETGTYNVNPNPKGEPWVIAPLSLTPKVQADLDAIPEWEPDKSKVLPVPKAVNHFREKEFRPIFNQKGGSCSAASGTGYNYTWEVNILTGAEGKTNRCMYYYPYNFLNRGGTGGIWYYTAWDILKKTGCVRESEWPSPLGSEKPTEWAKTYEAYHNANFDRCTNYYKISDPGDTGLEKLKQWMHDHGKGDLKGGVVTFNSNTSFGIKTIPSGSAEAGSKIATKFNGQGTAHAMIFAGYNDDVYYNANKKGAVLLVNSWGTSFGDRGILWVPYDLLKSEDHVYCVVVEKHTPRLEFKVALREYRKTGGKFTSGFSTSTTATNPDKKQTYGKAFQGNKGSFTGEIGLDCSSFWEEFNKNNTRGTFFLQSQGSGTIRSLSLMVYGKDGTILEKEIPCRETNVSIGTTMKIIVDQSIGIRQEFTHVTPNKIKLRNSGNVISFYLPLKGQATVTLRTLKGQSIATFSAKGSTWHTLPEPVPSGVLILSCSYGHTHFREKVYCK